MRRSSLVSAAAASLLLVGAAVVALPTRNAVAQSSEGYINLVELDIKPEDTAKFIEAAKENGAASVKDPGCRAFNIVVSRNDPNHIVFLEIYDNQAALDFHRGTDHYKKYQAATQGMVANRKLTAMAPIALNSR